MLAHRTSRDNTGDMLEAARCVSLSGDCHRAVTVRRPVVATPRARVALRRQRRRQLDLLHRNVRLHAQHARDAREGFHLEAPVVVDIGRDDAQQEIAVARHQVAFDDFRHLLDGVGETVHGFRVLPLQPHAREDRQALADFRGIQHGHVFLDHAGFLEQPHAPQARRWRQPDLVREFHVLHAAVALERAQDPAVDGVKFHLASDSKKFQNPSFDAKFSENHGHNATRFESKKQTIPPPKEE
ncbi:hypothetical protein BCEP27_130079 [Burkholderia cepacia]